MEGYRQYTKPAEVEKAINTLRGMIMGIAADGHVIETEAQELAHWCSLHSGLRDRHPFDEIIPAVEAALEDGVITPEEKEDILWVCDKVSSRGDYYGDVAASIQFLNGMVHGLLADGTMNDNEIAALQTWLTENDFLEGTYPFDELYSIVCAILQDHVVTEDERKTLMAFCSNLVDFTESYNLSERDFAAMREKYSVQGVCALCPTLEFEGKTFVLTGESYRASRAEWAHCISKLGGAVKSSVTSKTDYLIVGNAGNPCWAFSCYGRKIENAIQLRKKGAKVQIVNENDFWDAVEDAKIEA